MAACQDLPTILSSDPALREPVPSQFSARSRVDLDELQCYVSQRVQGQHFPYAYGILRFNWPANTHAPDGSLRTFRYRIQRPGEDPLVAGTCRIPNTPEATRFILKRLRLEAGTGRRLENGVPKREEQENPISIQGCVREGPCELEGFVVIGVPAGSDWGGWGTWSAGGGGGGDGLDASMGGSYEETGAGVNWDPGPDGTYRVACVREMHNRCAAMIASEAEWERIGKTIEAMRPNNAACAGTKAILQDMYALGRESLRFQTWSGFDIDFTVEPDVQTFAENRFDAYGRYIALDDFFLFDRPHYLIHEGLHAYYDTLDLYAEGLITQTGEQYALQYQKTCW